MRMNGVGGEKGDPDRPVQFASIDRTDELRHSQNGDQQWSERLAHQACPKPQSQSPRGPATVFHRQLPFASPASPVQRIPALSSRKAALPLQTAETA